MTIFVDDLIDYGKTRLRNYDWCHMWTDGSDEELDKFAVDVLKLHKEWSQVSKSKYVPRFYHYDLIPSKRELAIQHGAVYRPLLDYIVEMKAKHFE